jgi:uroporphyrinogen-III synthase
VRLLVTRPEPDASETAIRLRALGHEAILDPLLTIAFAKPPVGIAMPAAILITSRNALRALLRWPGVAAWRGRPLFAVGPESGALARASGFTDVRVGLGNARALTALVVAEFDPRAGTILYPAARNRAAEIDTELQERGINVRRVEAYRAAAAETFAAATEDGLRRGTIDGVLVFSRRTAAAFRAAAERAALLGSLGKVVFYALSEEAAEPLRALAGTAIRVAARQDSDGLFALLPPAG